MHTLHIPREPIVQKDVMVVDDDSAELDFIKHLITKFGHIVHQAQSASDALKIISQVGKLDLIITDLRMPGEDGISLAKKIRDEGVKIPICLVSGYFATNPLHDTDPILIRAKVCGVNVILPKAGLVSWLRKENFL